jgi:hypothetical protein
LGDRGPHVSGPRSEGAQAKAVDTGQSQFPSIKAVPDSVVSPTLRWSNALVADLGFGSSPRRQRKVRPHARNGIKTGDSPRADSVMRSRATSRAENSPRYAGPVARLGKRAARENYTQCMPGVSAKEDEGTASVVTFGTSSRAVTVLRKASDLLTLQGV